MVLAEGCRKHLAEVVHSRFAAGVGEGGGEISTETRHGGGDEDLGVLRNVLLFVACVEEREERHRGMEHPRHIRAQGLIELVQTRSADVIRKLLDTRLRPIRFGYY